MAGLFEEPGDRQDFEDAYIDRIVPDESRDLFNHSVAFSPNWLDMTSEEHMQAADIYANAVFSGSLSEAEYFTDMLEVDWDDDDIRDFFEAYEMLTG